MAVIICSFITASLHAGDTNWRMDSDATGAEIIKLSLITAVPVALFVASAFVPPEYRLSFLIAGGVTSLPAVAGITLFTIDLINYDPNKDPKVAIRGSELRASVRFYF